jgi:hypothetical protein
MGVWGGGSTPTSPSTMASGSSSSRRPTRLPGRVDPAATSFASASDLAGAMRRASAAHGEHEKRIGRADPNWPDWYAEYMVAEQAGTELPT